jgi:rod shape determining protein RodA
MFHPLPAREVPWTWLGVTTALTAFGFAFVVSATYDPQASWGFGVEAVKQMQWWAVAVVMCIVVMHIPFGTWKNLAVAAYIAGIVMELLMMAAAGSSLVPRIKGQANWLVLGPVSVQPTEFIKLTTLLALARLTSLPEFDARRLLHAFGALALAAFPAALIALGNDLGSALTFPAMAFGMLIAAGMRLRHLALAALLLLAAATMLIWHMPKDGYQYKRIQAWRNPDEYSLTEGYQTIRSMRSIGSGQWAGKGWGAGDQNRLGWLPEKHTDLIFAVVGEESGLLGSSFALALFLSFAWLGLYRSSTCRDPCGRQLIAGYVCLIIGQASINLAVAMGLMPVTGVTLPFFSYGGSSLLACHMGLGLAVAAGCGKREGTG